MKIFSKSINDGVLNEDFGGYSKKMKIGESPNTSFSLEWEKVPGAKSYALELIDYEASNVVGFPFIHWIVANIQKESLEENASKIDVTITQGANSTTPNGIVPNAFRAKSHEHASTYFGPWPPDQDHDYVLRVYALDEENLELKTGFFLGDMHRAMKNHIIDEGKLVFKYKYKN